jgi:hypothetical protein
MITSLPLPTRVSRIYPALSLTLAIAASVFFYAWQATRLDLYQIVNVQSRQKELETSLANLTAQHNLDKATLQVDRQKIADANTSLSNVQAKLADNVKSLGNTQQQLVQAQSQLTQQQDQLGKNASEISQLRSRPPLFSFQNKSSLADVTAKQAAVRKLITTAYTYMKDMYGDPYLLNSIKITFVDQFTIPGSSGEIVIQNSSKGIDVDIHLKDFDPASFQDNNTVAHEVTHAFAGVAVLKSSAMEEGRTVAATDAVMAKMIADGKLPHYSHLYLSLTGTEYASYNTTVFVPESNQLFYSGPDVAKIYQLIGTAWYNLYQEDPQFFKKFNAAYYPKVQQGLIPDDNLVRDTIASIVPSVRGTPIRTYLAQNAAFNPK